MHNVPAWVLNGLLALSLVVSCGLSIRYCCLQLLLPAVAVKCEYSAAAHKVVGVSHSCLHPDNCLLLSVLCWPLKQGTTGIATSLNLKVSCSARVMV
jgi:hypothetical protein